MKKSRYIGIIIMVFLLCYLITGCGKEGTKTENNTEDIHNNFLLYAEDSIKQHLKNPQSLMVNTTAFQHEEKVNDSYYCRLDIDFSAQNSFGGYEREVLTYYLCYENGETRELDRFAYFCEIDAAKYGQKLDSIENGVSFSDACSTDSVKVMYSRLENSGATYLTGYGYNITDMQDKTTYVTCVGNLSGFEGCLTYIFYDNKIRELEFTWQPEQGYFDIINGLSLWLAAEQSATTQDMDALIGKIDQTLGIEHTEIESTKYMSYAEPRAFQWQLSPDRCVYFEYVREVENGVVVNMDKIAGFHFWIKNTTPIE